MKLLLFLLLASPCFAQTADPLLIQARSGEVMTFIIDSADPADSFQIYRKTDVLLVPALVGSVAARAGVYSYLWSYTMPVRSTPVVYRFFVVVKKAGLFEGESNVARVRWIK